MIRRIWAVITNTFLEAGRNRAFLGLAIISIFFIISSIAISQLALPDQRARVLIDFGLFGLSIAMLSIAVVMGVILVFKEVDRKTFYLVIPKPVRRHEIILGKYFGLAAVVFLVGLVLTGVWLLLLHSKGVEIHLPLFKAAYLSMLEVFLILSVAVFFSTFATPIISGIFTVAFFIIGRIEYILVELMNAPKSMFHYYPWTKLIAKATLFFIPDLNVFMVNKQILLGIPISSSYILAATGYALAWIVVFLGLGVLIFQRREFL